MFSRIDFWLLFPAVFLAAVGSVILSSVSPYSFPQHFIYLGAALLTFLVFTKIDIKIIREFSPILYAVSLLALLITIIFGVVTRGAVRWISLGVVTLQPSELVKPVILLFLANLLARASGNHRFLLPILYAFPVFILVFLQPDLGSGLVILAGLAGVLFGGGIPLLWIVGGSILGVIASPAIWHILADYQRTRLLSFLSPTSDPLGAGYNALQAMIAVGSGGIMGRGLGQGTQSQLAFLPERHTDFIFSALSEELGFFGAFLVISSLVVLLGRIVSILQKSHGSFLQAFLSGAFFTIFFQVVVNIGMNLGVLPITGVPLPFVSSGGSSLVATAAILGMVSASRFNLKDSSD